MQNALQNISFNEVIVCNGQRGREELQQEWIDNLHEVSSAWSLVGSTRCTIDKPVIMHNVDELCVHLNKCRHETTHRQLVVAIVIDQALVARVMERVEIGI